jgi:hypothetical protein
MRLRAKSMLETIGKDYEEQFVKEESNEIDLIQGYVSVHPELKNLGESEKRTHLIPILIKEIRTAGDLYQVTAAFMALRKPTNQSFRVFDMDAVNSWCSEHASQCK